RENPLELDERLLEEHHVVQTLARQSALGQAELQRARRKPEVVLDTGKTLFFGSRHQTSVGHQRCRGVVKVAGDPEHVHQNCSCAERTGSAAVVTGCQPGVSVRCDGFRRITAAAGTTITKYITNSSTLDCTTAARCANRCQRDQSDIT